MKRLFIFLTAFLMTFSALAEYHPPLPYGVAAIAEFTLYNTDGTLDVDEVDGGTEVTIQCDRDAGTTATNDFVDEGDNYSISLTAAEMECAYVTLRIAATDTNVVTIPTFNHPSAAIVSFDPFVRANTAQAGTASSITLDASASSTTDDSTYCGHVVKIVEGTGVDQMAVASNDAGCYNGTTKVLTTSSWGTNPSSDSDFIIYNETQTIVNSASGVLESNPVQISGDATSADNLELQYDGTGLSGNTFPSAQLALATAQSDLGYITAREGETAAFLNCEVNTANFAGSTTTLACILTDRDSGAVTQATADLEGLLVVVTSGAQIREQRFINATTWDGVNSELQITLSRALPATLADAVTAVIK